MIQLSADVLAFFADDAKARADHDKIPCFQRFFLLQIVKTCADDALGAVSLYRTADLFGDRKTDTVGVELKWVCQHPLFGGVVLQNMDRYQLSHETLAPCKGLIVKVVFFDRCVFHKATFLPFFCLFFLMIVDRKKPRCIKSERASLCAIIGHRRFYRWYRLLRLHLIGQSLSAFRASSLKNISAVCSLHSLSEAMLLLSLELLGLVSSEHYLHLLIVLGCYPIGSVLLLQPFYAFTQ